jgi:hypothetical protein
MDPKGTLQHSQELSTYPYPEPDQSSPHPPIPPSKIHPNTVVIIRHLKLFLVETVFQFLVWGPIYALVYPIVMDHSFCCVVWLLWRFTESHVAHNMAESVTIAMWNRMLYYNIIRTEMANFQHRDCVITWICCSYNLTQFVAWETKRIPLSQYVTLGKFSSQGKDFAPYQACRFLDTFHPLIQGFNHSISNLES